MNIILANINFACLALILVLLPGCGMVGLPFTGQVTDAETGKPLEGVIVVALWKGEVNPIVDSKEICYHVETAMSDENGKFRVPGWIGGHWGVMGSYVVTEAYKKGYERVPIINENPKHEIKLVTFSGGIEARLDLLAKLVGPICNSDNGDSVRKLTTLSKNVYQEAEELAETRIEHKKRLDWMRYQLETLMFGLDEADKLRLERNKR